MPDTAPPAAGNPPAPPRQPFFDAGFYVLLAMMVAGGISCYAWRGADVFWTAFTEHLWLMLLLVPVMAGSVILASCMQVLIPPEFVRRHLGTGTGLGGILKASAIGAMTPGGPMISLPLLVALMSAGANAIAGVAFVTAWSAIPLTRIVQWQLPLMGAEFTLVQYLVSLPLPVVAALLAAPLLRRLLPPGTGKPD